MSGYELQSEQLVVLPKRLETARWTFTRNNVALVFQNNSNHQVAVCAAICGNFSKQTNVSVINQNSGSID